LDSAPFIAAALDYLWYFDSVDAVTFRWIDDLTPEMSRAIEAWVKSQTGSLKCSSEECSNATL